MSARPVLVKLAIARKELGLDEETYRAILGRLTGKTSARECTDLEIGMVLDELKAKGWKPRAPARRGPGRPADSPMAGKARGLWICLWHLGEVTDPSEAALEAFARRQLKCERLQWADQGQGYKLIEALKGWAERAAWPQNLTGLTDTARAVVLLKLRLIEAQCARLGIPDTLDRYDNAALDARIAELGARIRGERPRLRLVEA